MEWTNISVAVLIVIVLGVEKVIKWVWGYFNKAYKMKKDSEDFHAKVDRHDSEIKQLAELMSTFSDKFDKLFEVTKMQIRYSIVSSCNEALESNEIDQYQLQAIEDLYTVYTEVLHANSYVSTLVKKVRYLKIKNND